jgi:hypothetical protein
MRFIIFLLLLPLLECVALAFDKDTGERCQDYAKAGYCTKDPDTFARCPVTCSEMEQPEYPNSYGVQHFPDRMNAYFFEFRDVIGQKVELEQFKGHVTVVATVPIYPGMGQYWYDAMEHLYTIYSRKVRLLYIPLEGQDGLKLKVKPSSPLVVLENTYGESHPLLTYLNSIMEPKIFEIGKANLFVIDPQGIHVETLVSPTFSELTLAIDDQVKILKGEL